MNDWNEPQLWQLWRPFVGLHRWFIARGCPPTIRKLTGLTRVVHASVLTGAWGLISGVIAVLVITFYARMDYDSLTLDMIRLLVGGVTTAIPLIPPARWIGRTRFQLFLLIAWGAIWFALCPYVSTCLEETANLSQTPFRFRQWLHWSVYVSGLSVVQVPWIGLIHQPRSLRLAALALPIGLLSSTTILLHRQVDSYLDHPVWQLLSTLPFLDLVRNGLLMNYPLLVFQMLLVMTVGSLLWTSGSSLSDSGG